jgi:ComF family protein
MLQFLFDYLFPKNERIKEIEKILWYEIPQKAKPAPKAPHEFISALFSYKDQLVKDALWDLKYRANTKIAALFAPLILDRALEMIAEGAMFYEKEKPLIISIPPSATREEKRGFDQGKLILDALKDADTTGSFEITYDALYRARTTTQQSLLHNKSERLQNMHDVFAVQNAGKVEGKIIIVVDDICTTGATLQDAKRALEDSGARTVFGITIAH